MACLWEAIHASADLDKNTAVFNFGLQLVIIHDVGWDCPSGNPHVFVVRRVEERCDEVKI